MINLLFQNKMGRPSRGTKSQCNPDLSSVVNQLYTQNQTLLDKQEIQQMPNQSCQFKSTLQTFTSFCLSSQKALKGQIQASVDVFESWINRQCECCNKVYHMLQHCLSAIEKMCDRVQLTRKLNLDSIQFIEKRQNFCQRNIFLSLFSSYLKYFVQKKNEYLQNYIYLNRLKAQAQKSKQKIYDLEHIHDKLNIQIQDQKDYIRKLSEKMGEEIMLLSERLKQSLNDNINLQLQLKKSQRKGQKEIERLKKDNLRLAQLCYLIKNPRIQSRN